MLQEEDIDFDWKKWISSVECGTGGKAGCYERRYVSRILSLGLGCRRHCGLSIFGNTIFTTIFLQQFFSVFRWHLAVAAEDSIQYLFLSDIDLPVSERSCE